MVKGSLRYVLAKELDCSLQKNEFELQSRYYAIEVN